MKSVNEVYQILALIDHNEKKYESGLKFLDMIDPDNHWQACPKYQYKLFFFMN